MPFPARATAANVNADALWTRLADVDPIFVEVLFGAAAMLGDGYQIPELFPAIEALGLTAALDESEENLTVTGSVQGVLGLVALAMGGLVQGLTDLNVSTGIAINELRVDVDALMNP